MQQETKNRILFEETPVPRAVATMAIPTVIAQLIVLIYNVADTFFVGRANNPYMVAAASLLLPIYNISIAVSSIAGTGGGTLISRLLGKHEPDSAASVASFSMLFSLLGAAFFSVVMFCFMRPLLFLLGASSETFEYARQYAMCVIVVGAVPTILTMTMANLLRSVGAARQAGFGASMGGVLNIFLDPLFMFVILPRGHEILGAGIATALSNIIACIYFLVIIRKLNNPILQFTRRTGLPEKAHILSFFAVGLPAALGPFLFDLDYIVLDRLMSGYSDVALAAIGIVLKAERLPLNIGIGLCLGMVPLAAYNYTSGNHKRMKEVLLFTRRTGTVIGIVSIILYEIFAPALLRFFIQDPATVALGSQFLRIRALATIMMFLSFIYVHYFQAMGKARVALFLIVLRWAVINIPMLFLLNAVWGMYGIVWSQFISDTIVAILTYLTYRRFAVE